MCLRVSASLVTQGFHLVVVTLCAVELTLNQVTNTQQVVLVDFLDRFLVSLQGVVFTALGFVQYCLCLLYTSPSPRDRG